MYEIYETKAFVLRSVIKNDADQEVFLFTEDFGFIKVIVSGSKKDVSKHRNLVQNYSFINIFLIISKSGYRMTGGEFIENLYFLNINLKKEKILILNNIFTLIEKIFIKGEPDKGIFSVLEDFYFNLIKIENNIQKEEVLFLIDLLSQMGYLDKKKTLKDTQSEEDKISFLIQQVNTHLSEIDFN